MGRKTMSKIGALGLFTETPLHCGAESGSGYVDLPVQRERHTFYPLIPGSTLKGVMRDEVEARLKDHEDGKKRLTAIFGSTDSKEPRGGRVSFGDGILVAFPVRSSGAPFHWVTCPFVLERVARALGVDLAVEGVEKAKAWAHREGTVLLEELRLKTEKAPAFFDEGEKISRLLDLLPGDDRGFAYTRKIFRQRLLIVADEDFKELVEIGTEVLTRIKLNILGTTTTITREQAKADPELKDREDLSKWDLEGNMFVEEVVPPETLFLAPLRGTEDSAVGEFSKELEAILSLRIGGGETLGRGLTHLQHLAAPDAGGGS